jgi:hypothetical protein
MSAFEIRTLTKADGAAYRALRLEGLRLAPEAFNAAYESSQRSRSPTPHRSIDV